jgi:hypothetical protein
MTAKYCNIANNRKNIYQSATSEILKNQFRGKQEGSKPLNVLYLPAILSKLNSMCNEL